MEHSNDAFRYIKGGNQFFKNTNALKIHRKRNENNEALIKIKALKAELKEREKLWLDTLIITTIHENRLSKDN